MRGLRRESVKTREAAIRWVCFRPATAADGRHEAERVAVAEFRVPVSRLAVDQHNQFARLRQLKLFHSLADGTRILNERAGGDGLFEYTCCANLNQQSVASFPQASDLVTIPAPALVGQRCVLRAQASIADFDIRTHSLLHLGSAGERRIIPIELGAHDMAPFLVLHLPHRLDLAV